MHKYPIKKSETFFINSCSLPKFVFLSSSGDAARLYSWDLLQVGVAEFYPIDEKRCVSRPDVLLFVASCNGGFPWSDRTHR